MMPVRQQALPNLKRKQKTLPLNERAQLERVLGFTVANNAALATDSNTGLVAYPAGCVVVLYNPRRNKQSHLVNTSKKAITCVAFSGDGQYLATGECGHQPAVRVWDLEDQTQVAEFKGHKFGINVVAFSPNQRYLISIGSQHDMNINVWNWKTQSKVASNKVATKVTDVAFTEDGGTLVTVGNRHVKFWNMDLSKSRIKETVPLKGHSGILGQQKNNFFCGVCCGCGPTGRSTFVVTRSGRLCELNDKRLLDKWVELRTPSANCLAAGKHHIFVGCSNGVVRIFSTMSLHFLSTMPRPHHLGVDVASGLDPSSVLPAPDDARYPDTIALCLDDEASKLTCIYNDHSLYIWDVHDIKKIGKSRSFLYHSAAIWGLKFYPQVESTKQALPPGSFITCSSDDTIRVWNTEMHMSTDTAYKRNIYSNELIKVIYTDPDLNNIINVEFNPVTDKTDKQEKESNGVRSLSISHDGQNMASGDRVGNIRIHSLQFMDQIHMMEAHDSDVMCLSYTNPQSAGVQVLASAGRDRLLHVFDCGNNYDLVQTLDDHSAAITAVQFIINDEGHLTMVSCGADKSILFRTAQKDPDMQFILNKHLVAKTTLYDMCVDPKHKFMATACQDRHIRIYNTKNGKQKKSYSGSPGADGTLYRIDLDRSGSYVATSCSDKNLAIYDFYSGECVACMMGHSEIVTGIHFSTDFKHLVSVSGDGCIFQWRMPYELTEQMQTRMNDLQHGSEKYHVELSGLDDNDFLPSKAVLNNLQPDMNANVSANARPMGQPPPGTPSLDYRFSVGQLPSWAKRQMSENAAGQKPPDSNQSAGGPKGCWAQRVDNQVVIKSVLDESSMNGGHNQSGHPVQTIIADDESNKDDDDDDDFRKSHADEILKKLEAGATFSSSFNSKITFGRGESMDTDDDPLPEKDVVVFFPPKDDEESVGGETVASSYKVYEGGNVSSVESEGTEPHSLDSEDEEPSRTSLPDTSGSVSPDGDQVMRTNFALDLSSEEFGTTFREPAPTPADMSHRLSISTRFLTRSQQLQLRNTAGLQRRKEEMAQAVMETRRRLQALGWKAGDTWNRTAIEQAVPERDLTPSSPPSSPDKSADDRGPIKRLSGSGRTQTVTRDRSDTKGSVDRASSTQNRSRRDEATESVSPNRSTSMQNLSHNNGSAADGKTAKPLTRSQSYRSATQSSKAKNRQSTGGTKEPVVPAPTSVPVAAPAQNPTTRRSVGRKGRLNPALKNKFKSTPDLTIPENDVTHGLGVSKTMEDMDTQPALQRRGSADINPELYRHSMQATRDKELFTMMSRDRPGANTPDTVAMSQMSVENGTATPAVSQNMTAVENKADISLMMLPPPTTTVPKVPVKSRRTMPELTLAQAKEIVRNPASVSMSTGAGSRRSVSTERSSGASRQRPRSIIGLSTEGNKPTERQNNVQNGSIQNGSHCLSNINTVAVSTAQPDIATAKPCDTNNIDSFSEAKLHVLTSRSQKDKMAASPMDLPEKDINRTIVVANEQIRSSADLVFTAPSRPSLPSQDQSSVDSDSVNERRNVTFVVGKEGTSSQPGSPIKSPGASCLVNRLGRLGSSLSPIHPTSVGGEPDVDGQEDDHESLPFIADLSDVAENKPTTEPGRNENFVPKPSPGLPEHLVQASNSTNPANILTHLTRRRDPNSRNCVSPSRQLNSTAGLPSGGPPNVPPPKTPPRISLGSTSPSRDTASGRISPAKSLSALNREAGAARWQRAQQNRDQRQRSGRNSRENSVQDSGSESEVSEASCVSSGGESHMGSEPKSAVHGDKLSGGSIRSASVDSKTSADDEEPRMTSKKVDSPAREPSSLETNGHRTLEGAHSTSVTCVATDSIPSSEMPYDHQLSNAMESEEIRRPDKTRSSPPASLTTAVTVSVHHSVVLAQPSPAIVTSPVSTVSATANVDPSTEAGPRFAGYPEANTDQIREASPGSKQPDAEASPVYPRTCSPHTTGGRITEPSPIAEVPTTFVTASMPVPTATCSVSVASYPSSPPSLHESSSSEAATVAASQLTSLLEQYPANFLLHDNEASESSTLRRALLTLQTALSRVLGPPTADFTPFLAGSVDSSASSGSDGHAQAASELGGQLLDYYSQQLCRRVCHLITHTSTAAAEPQTSNTTDL